MPGPKCQLVNVVGLMAADCWFPAAKTEFNLKLPLEKIGRVTGAYESIIVAFTSVLLLKVQEQDLDITVDHRDKSQETFTQKTPRHSAVRFTSLLL